MESCSTFTKNLTLSLAVKHAHRCVSLINASLSINLYLLVLSMCTGVCMCVFSDRINLNSSACSGHQTTRSAKSAERGRETKIGKARRGEAGDFLYSICPPPQCGYVQNLSLDNTLAKLGCVGLCVFVSHTLSNSGWNQASYTVVRCADWRSVSPGACWGIMHVYHQLKVYI